MSVLCCQEMHMQWKWLHIGAAAARPWGRGQEWRGELLVEAEEEFDALAV